MVIPKIIHYCWLSGEPIPQKYQECMDTWKKVMPEYEWVRWDLDRFDMRSNRWVYEAYQCKKYAFAADYIRLYAVYTMGGIYLDMDVMVLKSFDDFLDNDFFTFNEFHPKLYLMAQSKNYVDKDGKRIKGSHVPYFGLQAAAFGGVKGSAYIKDLMSFYENGKSFFEDDGAMCTDILAPYIYSVEAEKWGYRYKDRKQVLGKATIYPSSYFAGYTNLQTPESYAVHVCAHGWKTKGPLLTRLKNKFNYWYGYVRYAMFRSVEP